MNAEMKANSDEHGQKKYKLNVQGVVIESDTSSISVHDAITKAGFDADQEWLIFLKVQHEPKRPVTLATMVDLTTPGIEKLRLTPKDVNNGEVELLADDFALLDHDEQVLDGLGLPWETLLEAERRWLLIHGYPVPDGYTVKKTLLALEIPPTYPSAQIDMFYCFPALALTSGRTIDRTQVRATIRGDEFHGWSRHRGGGSPWNPELDNVTTHLALVDHCIAKEVE